MARTTACVRSREPSLIIVDEHGARSTQLLDVLLDAAQRGAVGAEGDGAVEAVEVDVARAEHLEVVGEAGEVVFGERRRRLQDELLLRRDDEHAVADRVEEAHALGELLHHIGERAGQAEHRSGTVALEAARTALDREREVRAGRDEVHRVVETALGDIDIAQPNIGQRIAVFGAAQQERDIGGGLDGELEFVDIDDIGGGAQALGRSREVGVARRARPRLAAAQEGQRTGEHQRQRDTKPRGDAVP